MSPWILVVLMSCSTGNPCVETREIPKWSFGECLAGRQAYLPRPTACVDRKLRDRVGFTYEAYPVTPEKPVSVP